MFKRIKDCFLEPNGIFIFDISTEYKLKNIIGNNIFINDGDEVFYSWENRYIRSKKLSDMYLNFFIRNQNGSYKRFSERHLQKAYTSEEIIKIAKKAGFNNIDLFDGISFNKATDISERITFVLR